ncbi:unnamed protein product [Mytilus coruscus]|uniref:Uncharacterized protein n=1 Tax=Mytilus coruscus TaxID=42192 RepID=A0A6J8BTS2_MYTCO|nr:unnamed protein product [Mytilus coruscus]
MADLQTRVMRSRFFVFIAGLQIVPFGIPYRLTCPQQSHWKILSTHMCPYPSNYTCLLNILTLEYQQNCKGPKIIAPGSKYVWQPNFNRGECDAGRYQPFIFRTEGYTNCLFLKSRCYSEGQATFSNGSTKMDRSCYCDITRGYVFVSSTHDKYCIPSEEDCSCHKNITEGVTNIYDTDTKIKGASRIRLNKQNSQVINLPFKPWKTISDLHNVDNTTDHTSEQSRVIHSVHTVRDYDDIRYNIIRNENARNEAARLVLIMYILMFFISYPSAVIITKACQRLRMTTCVQCYEDANNNRAIEDDEQKDIESGTSCEMAKRQNVLTGLDKCVIKRYMSNLDNTEVIEFASILRHKGLISKSAYSYIESCYKNHDYHNMRSAAIRNSTEMHTDLRNVVFVMYNLDSKYKSWACQLYTTFKNVLELRPFIVYRVDIKDRTCIQAYFDVMKKSVQKMEFENPVEYLTNLSHQIQMTGQRCDQTKQRIFTEICDKYIVLVALTIDALANKTNDIDPRGNLFNEIEAIISKSSCPDLSRCMLYGRKAVALSFQNKQEEGEDMEKMALICAANVVPCLETVDMFYKLVLFHRAWYEKNPQKELMFIAEVKQKAFDILKDMGDEIRLFWSRRFVVRLLFCYLGLGMRCRFLPLYQIQPKYTKESELLLKTYDSNTAEIRIQMLFYIAKARLSHLKGDLKTAIAFNEEAKKIATKGAYSELKTILDNEQILLKSWSLSADLLQNPPYTRL